MPRHVIPVAQPASARSVDAADYQFAAPAVTAMRKEYPAGADTRMHAHPRAQLIYAVRGAMRVATERGVYALPPMRALWVPGGVTHHVEMRAPVSMRTLYIRPDIATRLWPACQVIEVSGLLRELILTLVDEPIDYPNGGYAEQVANLIVSTLARARVLPFQVPWPADRRLQSVCRAILDNPATPLRIEDWGHEVGASGRTMIRLFQAECGMNYRDWLQQVRLAEAVCQLALGTPIARIAAQLGYRSPSAFAAMFHRVLGAPPQHYLRDGGR